MFADVDDS